MQQPLWIFFVVYFSFVNICDAKRQKYVDSGVPYALSRLFEGNSKKPIILLLEDKENIQRTPSHKTSSDKSEDSSSDTSSDSGDHLNLRSSKNDERAYVLYHLLRTTLEDENLDPRVANTLEATKQHLRQALIARCGVLGRCKNKCDVSPVAKYSCTLSCQETFDDLHVCEEARKPKKPKKTKCNKGRCGKTMPPAWLLRI